MKREEKIILLIFIALLFGGLGIAVLLGKTRAPSATIQFSQASVETSGRFILNYSFSQSSGTYLRDTTISNGRISGNGGSGYRSLLGLRSSGGGGSATSGFGADAYPLPTPTLLVETGKTYTIDYQSTLRVYDFTNKSGGIYRLEFKLEPLR